MADILTTLHRKDDPSDNIYPNVKDENIPDTIQRKLSAGENISIDSNNTISATFAQSLTDQLGAVEYLNVIDNDNLTTGYINEKNEVVSTNVWYHPTTLAPVSTGITYYVYGLTTSGVRYSCNGFWLSLYDKDGAFISSKYISSNSYVVTDTDAVYLRLSININNAREIYFAYSTIDKDQKAHYPYLTIYTIQQQISDLSSKASFPLVGKNLLCCGDSITYGSVLSKDNGGIDDNGNILNFGYWISSYFNMPYTNEGHPGGTIANGDTSKYNFVTNYKTIFDKLAGTETYLTLWFGANDQGSIDDGKETEGTYDNTYNGDSTLDTTSFLGAYQTILYDLVTNESYDQFHVLVVIPHISKPTLLSGLYQMCLDYGIQTMVLVGQNLPRLYSQKWTNLFYWNGTSTNAQWATNTIGTGSLPSNVSAGIQNKYTFDGVHPTEFGHKSLASWITSYLMVA